MNDDDDSHGRHSDVEHDNSNEAYIMLLLSDSNLPTGSFVASSGLESYVKHGFIAASSDSGTISFIRDSLATYARSALPFVSDAHHAVQKFCRHDIEIEQVVENLTALDELYSTMTLNHVARRASKSQGVALLTLYTKGFSRPSSVSPPESIAQQTREIRLNALIDQLKLMVRKEDTYGHLPICWGVLAAALGLTLGIRCFYFKRTALKQTNRAYSIPPPLLARTKSPLSFSPPQHSRPIWSPTNPASCRSTSSRSRSVKMQRPADWNIQH